MTATALKLWGFSNFYLRVNRISAITLSSIEQSCSAAGLLAKLRISDSCMIFAGNDSLLASN